MGTGSLTPVVNVWDTQGSKLILDGSAHSDLKSDSETLGWLGYVCLSSFGPPVALWRAVITCKSVSVPDQGKVYCQGLYGQYTSPRCCQPVSLITSPLHPPHWCLPSTWTSVMWRESLTQSVRTKCLHMRESRWGHRYTEFQLASGPSQKK